MGQSLAPLLEVRGIWKQFPGVQALADVRLRLHHGEVLAVIGENGAGKSTLMKILAGVEIPDEGEILIENRPVVIDSVRRAMSLGVALIHQELNLCDNLDVGANIYLGREPRRLALIRKRRIELDAKKYLQMVGLDCSPRMPLRELSVGRQQLVEIAKALSASARILIMDEPTSSLSSGEADRLFEVIDDLRRQGVSIVYISHRLGEVRRVADRVLVLRDGVNAGELAKEEIDHDRMVQLMVGRDISQFYARRPHKVGEVALSVRNLRTSTYPQHALNFSLRQGEILGVAGLVGAGRTEMLQALFGAEEPLGGEILLGGQRRRFARPQHAIAAGLALVPEDRKQYGLILGMTVRENLTLPRLRRDTLAGFLNRRAERRVAAQMIDQLSIKTPSGEQIVQYLSGGNQQKTVIGKWLAMEPRVLLLDEPTRGIDVGAKQEVYRLMEELAEDGVALLFVSSEMEEILGMSDRVLVMHEGRIAGELSRDQLSEEAVMRLATGESFV